MDERTLDRFLAATHWPRKMAALALGALALFLVLLSINTLKSYRYIGSGVPASNTITVSGTGDVFAIPDIATFTVTVEKMGKDVSTAQGQASIASNEIVAYLKGGGIDEKDIQTTDYNVNPQYEWSQASCPPRPLNSDSPVYCPPGKQVLTGYQVSQTLTVKVRDTKKAGDILSGVGSRGATNVSGLSFSIDNEDTLKAQARDKAIAKAKVEARALAQSLGVQLVRIVGFSENEGGYPPVYFAKAMSADSAGSAAPSPEIPTGQNKITENISLTYEIQ